MLDRRDLLKSGLAATLLPMTSVGGASTKTQPPDPARPLDALFDRFVRAQLERSPETATGLGLD